MENMEAENLEAQGHHPVAVPLDDLRAGPSAHRHRWLTGVVAAMLVAGAGGAGFGLGRSVASDDDGVVGPSGSVAATVVPTTGQPVGEETDAADVIGTQPPPAAVPTVVPASDAAEEVAEPGTASGRFEPFQSEYALIAESQLEGAIRVRALLGPEYGAYEDVGSSGWTPAPFCWGNRELRVTVDGPDIVDVSSGQWYGDLYGDAAVALQADLGWADGRPMRLLAVQAAPNVTRIDVRWDDGASVGSEVEDGLALLLVDGGSAWEGSFELDLHAGDDVTTLGQRDLDHSDDPQFRAACNPPPPELPEPGEQPSDPDAERAAIGERFRILWDQDTPAEEKPEVLDDRTGVDDAVAAVFEGGFAEVARTAEHRIEEVVFTSPATAWFRYSIDTDSGWFGDRFGVAKLTGDGWIFPRALICQDVALAGGMCEPPTDVIYPPSWYEQNGEQCVYEPVHPEGRCFTYEESEVSDWF